MHEKSCMLNLTYDDDHLPEHGQLWKDDLQRFFKRLRKKFKFRYVASGEYGEKTRRPHFHIAFWVYFLNSHTFHLKWASPHLALETHISSKMHC